MIDPASAIALATAAFSGRKKQSTQAKKSANLAKTYLAFGRAVSDLDYLGAKA